MTTYAGIKPSHGLESVGIAHTGKVFWNLSPAELTEHSLCRGQGKLADNGALCVDTGTFTGRSPKDKFVVEDALTRNTVWWGDINQPISGAHFERLLMKMQAYLQGRDLFIRDVYAGADAAYRIAVRVINLLPWQNLFVNDLFIRPEEKALRDFVPDWTIIAAPDFYANPETDGTRARNFSVIDFSRKMILIGGTSYAGENKKSVFTLVAVIPARSKKAYLP